MNKSVGLSSNIVSQNRPNVIGIAELIKKNSHFFSAVVESRVTRPVMLSVG